VDSRAFYRPCSEQEIIWRLPRNHHYPICALGRNPSLAGDAVRSLRSAGASPLLAFVSD